MKKLISLSIAAVIVLCSLLGTLTLNVAANHPDDANYLVTLEDKTERTGLTGYYKSYAQAVAAINGSDCEQLITVTMLRDVNETESSILTYPHGVVFEGNGKTITTNQYNFICIGNDGEKEEMFFAVHNLTVNTAGEGNIFCFRQPGTVELDSVTVNSTGALRWCLVNLNCSGGRVNVFMNAVTLKLSGTMSYGNTSALRMGNTNSIPSVTLVDCVIDALGSVGDIPALGIYSIPTAATIKIRNSTVKANGYYAILCDNEPTLLEIDSASKLSSVRYPDSPIFGTAFTQDTEAQTDAGSEITSTPDEKTDTTGENTAQLPEKSGGCAGIGVFAQLVALSAAAVIIIKKK